MVQQRERNDVIYSLLILFFSLLFSLPFPFPSRANHSFTMPGSQKDDVKVFMHSNQRGSAEIIRFFCREAGIVFHEVDIDAATFEAMKSDNSIMFGELPAIQIGDDDAHFIEGP